MHGRHEPTVPPVAWQWPSRGRESHPNLVHNLLSAPGRNSLCRPEFPNSVGHICGVVKDLFPHTVHFVPAPTSPSVRTASMEIDGRFSDRSGRERDPIDVYQLFDLVSRRSHNPGGFDFTFFLQGHYRGIVWEL
jgi:hypothetical protein